MEHRPRARGADRAGSPHTALRRRPRRVAVNRYTVSLSAGGWVDLVQDGHFLKPKAFSGATDCDGIRKTMKYELSAGPFVLQVSGSREAWISIAILPSE